MTSDLKPGLITDSGNFELVKRINSLDEFWSVLKADKSIFARHRMYPCAFFESWQIRLVEQWINMGWFYTAKKIN